MTKADKRKNDILLMLIKEPGLSKELLAKNLHVGLTTIKRDLRELKKEGIIDRIGSDKNGQWKIKR